MTEGRARSNLNPVRLSRVNVRATNDWRRFSKRFAVISVTRYQLSFIRFVRHIFGRCHLGQCFSGTSFESYQKLPMLSPGYSFTRWPQVTFVVSFVNSKNLVMKALAFFRLVKARS